MIKETEIKVLKKISNELRIKIIEMLYRIGTEYKGHPGPALSIVDIVSCLYFKLMNVDPAKPDWPERDRLILSKGHACPAIYVALARKGYFINSHLYTLRHIGSILQGHPDMRKTPGIDMTTGSLGNGLGAGVGIALAANLDKRRYKTYVIIGDGEMQEGLIWESIMIAGHYKLKNLIAIVDKNNWQSCDCIQNTCDIEPLESKFISFNWNVKKINGHDIKEIINAFNYTANKPLVIIANTIKGKGVSFMENNNTWHQKGIDIGIYNKAIKELKEIGRNIG